MTVTFLVTCKIENRFQESSVHFYLNLSSMSIVLAKEAVQITVKNLSFYIAEFPSKYSVST